MKFLGGIFIKIRKGIVKYQNASRTNYRESQTHVVILQWSERGSKVRNQPLDERTGIDMVVLVVAEPNQFKKEVLLVAKKFCQIG